METALYVLTVLVVAPLAVWQIIEIWHHSHLMAGLRARTDLWEGFFGQLVGCPFCLSPWVSLIVVAALFSGFWLADESGGDQPIVGYCLLSPFLAFAVARLANIGNDLSHSYCRTPRDNGLPDLDDE